ncbi:hypothetical protein IVB40_13590 [Bradyrhizobium sp. 40]|uniref:hypothetical protein n=1 Tax=Bradyrhizobium sp. 40 TaxID=2782674 RepID=UPI001FFFD8EE|nr:hypothetical protein [Bradyrhizobium sp. 40]UPJ44976.1 hypothetical protein IVB40_13590 [Bradyrhizobium sp. 40]
MKVTNKQKFYCAGSGLLLSIAGTAMGLTAMFAFSAEAQPLLPLSIAAGTAVSIWSGYELSQSIERSAGSPPPALGFRRA